MSGMTFTKKLDHLWTYYKWVLVIAVIAVIVICTVFSSIRNKQIETLFSGMLINVEVSEEGRAYLTDQWQAVLGEDPRKQKVDLTTTFFQDPSTSLSLELEAGSIIQVTALVAAKELDYMMLDDVGFDYYKDRTVFAPLEEIFSAEQLKQIEDRLKYHADEEYGRYPIAIDISDIPFAADCLTGSENVYIAFPGNTGRTEQNSRFLDYLLNWE